MASRPRWSYAVPHATTAPNAGPGSFMVRQIRTCALIGRFQDARVAECTQPLVSTLQARGLGILALDDTGARAALPSGVSLIDATDLAGRADLVIAIGG